MSTETDQTSPLSQASQTEPAKTALQVALESLNPEDDSHWTQDGQPVVAVVNGLLVQNGAQTVTRSDIDARAPNFDRDYARNLKAIAEGQNGGGGAPADPGEAPAEPVGDEPQPTEEEPPAEPEPTEPEEPKSLEDRVSALEAENAALRAQFGWPTTAEMAAGK